MLHMALFSLLSHLPKTHAAGFTLNTHNNITWYIYNTIMNTGPYPDIGIQTPTLVLSGGPMMNIYRRGCVVSQLYGEVLFLSIDKHNIYSPVL